MSGYAILNLQRHRVGAEEVSCETSSVGIGGEACLRDLVRDYTQFHASLKKSFRTHYRGSLACIEQYFHPDTPLSSITPRQVEAYRLSLIKMGLRPASINRRLSCLKHLFAKAVSWRLMLENPASSVGLMRENNKRTRYLVDDEEARLLSFCKGRLRMIVRLAANTGLRKGELRALKWEDVDFKSGHIAVREPKNGEARFVPLNSSARGVLQEVVRDPASPYLFPGKGGGLYNFRKSFETARRKAGIKNFRFHDLRHDFGSNLAMQGVDLNTIRELLGHKSLAMTLRYSHLSRKHMGLAVERLCDVPERGAAGDSFSEKSFGDVAQPRLSGARSFTVREGLRLHIGCPIL